MHKSATKCNETIGKWCKNKHGASKIIDTLETYHAAAIEDKFQGTEVSVPAPCRDREGPPEPSPSVSIAVSIDLTAISIAVAVSDDEEGVVLPRG
jgi:hypothetical protein